MGGIVSEGDCLDGLSRQNDSLDILFPVVNTHQIEFVALALRSREGQYASILCLGIVIESAAFLLRLQPSEPG